MADPEVPAEMFAAFGQMFSEFFGGTSAPRGDIQVSLQLTKAEAARGTRKPVAITRGVACESCAGMGSKTPGATRAVCTTCAGSGQRTATEGHIVIGNACPACRGALGAFADPCAACAGSGARDVAATLEVKVPPGMEEGNTLRLAHAGSHVPGREAGHLFIKLHVIDRAAAIPHARVERLGGVRPRRTRLIYAMIAVVAIACTLTLLLR